MYCSVTDSSSLDVFPVRHGVGRRVQKMKSQYVSTYANVRLQYTVLHIKESENAHDR
jgi:hypothetical protein